MQKKESKIETMLLIFRQNLKTQRKKLGFTQKDLAEILQSAQNVQSRYELGLVYPQVDYLYKLSELGFDVPSLLFSDEDNGVYILEGHEQTLLDLYRECDNDTRLNILGQLTAAKKGNTDNSKNKPHTNHISNNHDVDMIVGSMTGSQKIEIKK